MLKLEITHSKLTSTEIYFKERNPIDRSLFYRAMGNCLNNIIQNRGFILYVNGADKNNPICEFGDPTMVGGKRTGYTYVKNPRSGVIYELADEPIFLSGELYIILGKVSADDVYKFYMCLNSSVRIDFAGMEFVFVNNDGNTLCWVNPLDNHSFIDEIKKIME